MPARDLLALFDSVYVLALTAWVGSVLFFTFGVAPIIFPVLGSEGGAKFVRALFPRYYRWGALSGSVALPAYVAGPLCVPEYRGPLVGVEAAALLVCTLVMLYAGNSLVPEINRARDAGPSGHERFRQLHRRSVGLNALVLIVGVALLVGFVIRPAPRTEGIVELSPAARAGYDAAVNQVIEEIEARRGLRPPRARRAAGPGDAQRVLDAGTIREIESYYPPQAGRGGAVAEGRPAADSKAVGGEAGGGRASGLKPDAGPAPKPATASGGPKSD